MVQCEANEARHRSRAIAASAHRPCARACLDGVMDDWTILWTSYIRTMHVPIKSLLDEEDTNQSLMPHFSGIKSYDRRSISPGVNNTASRRVDYNKPECELY